MKRQHAARDAVFTDPVFAARYARKHETMERRFGEEYAAKLRARRFRTGRILDAGCGFGETLIHLAASFPEASLTGIDLSDPLLEIARSKCSEAGLLKSVEFQKADVCRMPFPDRHFNVALNINMVHIVEQPRLMLDELERVLAVDGFFFIVDIRRSWLGILEREFLSAFTEEEAKHILSNSSLRKGTMTSTTLWWRYER